MSSQLKFFIPSNPSTVDNMRQTRTEKQNKTKKKEAPQRGQWHLELYVCVSVCVFATVTYSYTLGCSSYCHVSLTQLISTLNSDFFSPPFLGEVLHLFIPSSDLLSESRHPNQGESGCRPPAFRQQVRYRPAGDWISRCACSSLATHDCFLA